MLKNTIRPITFQQVRGMLNQLDGEVITCIYKNGSHRGANVGSQLGSAFRSGDWGHFKMKGIYEHQTDMLKEHLDRMMRQMCPEESIRIHHYAYKPVYAIFSHSSLVAANIQHFTHPHLFFDSKEFRQHTNSLFNSEAINQAHRDYSDGWDKAVMMEKLKGNGNPGSRRLPREMAKRLEWDKNNTIQREVRKQLKQHREWLAGQDLDYRSYIEHFDMPKFIKGSAQ